MSELSLSEKAITLGAVIESVTGAHPVGKCPGENTFGIHFAIHAMKDAAALASIIGRFPNWRIETLEGNELTPIFCLHFRGKSESPDLLPLIEALFAFRDRAAMEKTCFLNASNLVM